MDKGLMGSLWNPVPPSLPGTTPLLNTGSHGDCPHPSLGCLHIMSPTPVSFSFVPEGLWMCVCVCEGGLPTSPSEKISFIFLYYTIHFIVEKIDSIENEVLYSFQNEKREVKHQLRPGH